MNYTISRILAWIVDHKLVTFLSISLFAFVIATISLASVKNSLAEELDQCKNQLSATTQQPQTTTVATDEVTATTPAATTTTTVATTTPVATTTTTVATTTPVATTTTTVATTTPVATTKTTVATTKVPPEKPEYKRLAFRRRRHVGY